MPTERQDLEIEVFKIINSVNDTDFMFYDLANGTSPTATLKKMKFSDEEFDKETVEMFLNILFDSVAVQQNNLKVKNIYTGVVDDPDLCEIE